MCEETWIASLSPYLLHYVSNCMMYSLFWVFRHSEHNSFSCFVCVCARALTHPDPFSCLYSISLTCFKYPPEFEKNQITFPYNQFFAKSEWLTTFILKVKVSKYYQGHKEVKNVTSWMSINSLTSSRFPPIGDRMLIMCICESIACILKCLSFKKKKSHFSRNLGRKNHNENHSWHFYFRN